MLGAGSIAVVLDVLRPERAAWLQVLESLDTAEWERPTECPAYTVKGIATHLLGDDLSLLSRQPDSAENGLIPLAAELPGADFGACSTRSTTAGSRRHASSAPS